MINRVTMQTTSTASQRGMQANAAKLAEAQLRANTLQKNVRLSDDPAAAAESMAVRAAQAQATQHGRNIDSGDAWMTTANGALDTSVSLLQHVQSLTLQGSNAALTQEARDALATELDSIRGELLVQANTKLVGRSIFAGNSDAKSAFLDGTPPTFTGEPNSTVQRRVNDATTIRVDADGAAIFGTNDRSVFGLISQLSADLRSGVDISTSIDPVNAALNNVIGQRSELGARHAELLRAKDSNITAQLDLESHRAGVEDLDLGAAILDLKTQELAYQASLGVTAKVLQTTLMDFLR
ncbi:flagellin [Arthrobacter sp. LAPM80]|uniref:flagellin N-terminal helical domain-containing protein n=1 Tax=Arthrobacter sp. LAPM80 TaxID=3141788 RepID=UPI00398A73A9